jgi:hypothetical protein
MKWLMLAVSLAVALVVVPAAHAARIITAQFDVDGERVLETFYSDDGYPTPHEVLWYLAAPPNNLRDERVKITPLADNPLAADLTGEVVVTLRNGRGEFKVDKLRLVRDSAEDNRWYLPREEIERVESQIPPTRQVQPPATASTMADFGLVGGVVLLVLLAIAVVVMFMPRGTNSSN